MKNTNYYTINCVIIIIVTNLMKISFERMWCALYSEIRKVCGKCIKVGRAYALKYELI